GWRSTAVAVCAALLIAIVGWQLSRPSGVQLSQADFSRLAAIEPHQLTEFAGQHTAELPAGWSAVPGRFAIQGPKGLPSTEAAHPFVAVYTFQLRQRSGMISGML